MKRLLLTIAVFVVTLGAAFSPPSPPASAPPPRNTIPGSTPLPAPSPTPTPAPSFAPTDRIPSFTDEQARLGQTIFYENCAECHGGELQGHVGPALATGDGNVQWDSVTYVYNYMKGHMPAGNAGALPKDQYLDIMAFLLKQHGHVPGSQPLTEKAATQSKALLGPP